MARLDLRPGHANDTKTYSDGSIEQEILRAVSAGGEMDWYADKRWPIIYHFSPLRSNIVNWYPFKKDASVLEIGAGCGALTGYLCDRVAHVTSVEKSALRSDINLKRHAAQENLDIVVDDFATMELADKYDYVVVIGVMEYAAWTSPGENPADAFLRKAASFLKPDGKMLLAIENRLGFKYLSGAREDHLGRFFAGINNYVGESVRTYSRQELVEKIEGAGLHVSRFFYPYPDYKFPEEIFTDESVNERFPISTDYRMDASRISLFSVKDFYQGLMTEGCAGNFANSFLVEITLDDALPPTPYKYVKVSNNRKAEMSICTVITDTNQVMKRALYTCGEGHIRTIALLGGHAYTAEMRNVACTAVDKNAVVFPFVEGSSLQDKITAVPQAERKPMAMAWFRWLKDALYSISDVHVQGEGDTAFRKVVGDQACVDPLHWVPCGNVDMIPSNIFGSMGDVTLIDYEWELDMPVPAEYSLWRFMISLVYDSNLLDPAEASDDRLAELLGCSVQTLRCFEQWNFAFANNYVGMKSMVALSQPAYPLDLDDAINARRLIREQHAELLQVYGDKGVLTQTNQYLTDALMEAKQGFAASQKQVTDLTNKLRLIEGSKTWRIRTKLRHIIRK